MWELRQISEPSKPISTGLTKMALFHRRYSLPNDTNYTTSHYLCWDEMMKDIIKNENILAILPVYGHDHSCFTISTTPFSCKWDSGQLGFIFITKETFFENFGGQRATKRRVEEALKILVSEIEEYNAYLNGDVWEIVDENGDSDIEIYGEENAKKILELYNSGVV